MQPADVDPAGVADRSERVGALRAVDGDRVGRAVAARAGTGEVGVDRRQVGARQVADHHVVGTAEGAERDGLDVVEVHRHVGDVADETHPAAVGGDVDVLRDVGAVESQRVAAVLALDGVAAVTRIPLEGVVTGAEQRDVVAVVAEDGVVAVPADHRVGPLRAADGRRCRRRRRG